MRCAWDALTRIIPSALRPDVDKHKDTLQELRLRLEHPPEMICANGVYWGTGRITEQNISFVVNTASQYSPWAAATAAKGYITAPGGHRIGLCGEVAMKAGVVTGIRSITSLCIRVARDFPGIAANASSHTGNILILGPPGCGKTTLLRDLIRQLSNREKIAVVDERGELFPTYLDRGPSVDVLTGCTKAQGVEMVLRTMGPTCIAVDEITAEEDCKALLEAGWCGVRLLATVHAASRTDLSLRPVYRPLWDTKLFQTILILHSDKSWRAERISV